MFGYLRTSTAGRGTGRVHRAFYSLVPRFICHIIPATLAIAYVFPGGHYINMSCPNPCKDHANPSRFGELSFNGQTRETRRVLRILGAKLCP